MSQNGNPLIGTTKADTIEGTHGFVEWMIAQAGNDEGMHPGMIAALRLVYGALDSLLPTVVPENN